MKRIILFFTVCLGLSAYQTTFANDTETVRVANKRTNTATVSSANNRITTSNTKRTENTQNKNARTTTQQIQQRGATRTPVIQNIKSRTTHQQTQQKNVTQRAATTKNTAQNRTVNARKSNTVTNTRSAVSNKSRKSLSRATELNTAKIESIKSANYSKCKTVYYECMDEFCANKDSNLRRCACSSRIHEFDNIKKQLSTAEDKMLDFNQRLLLVGLDKEDAMAVNSATEGELAFETKDTSESEKLLQKITKTLNSSGDSKINNNLSSISLSLDMDSAWDNIDSLSGISTTSKNGLALYNTANPVCIKMAKEVCTDEEMTIVQDGYKLTIQQDCNTVAKSYDTQYNNAINKIHESGALLDMSRLNIYQQRNSDDTLTCKKKILDQLSDASVCGTNLYKCLDMTGEYIDPSTGTAFLSGNLHKLIDLIQEPIGEEKWSKIQQNEPFVNFLKSKKKFLTTATKQCQDISDTIWDEFLDDALSQIKLAQKAKLEEVKRGCTTLVTECKTNALTSLSAFDARALSVFKVAADKTANEMCRDIQDSCISLMNTDSGNTWSTGITGIATDITYDAIIETCAQVGRDCIIQKCNGTSGNFALCTNITADNRMAILNRDACWNEVLNCVNGADNLNNIQPNYTDSNITQTSYYNDNCVDNACLITRQIWGDCDKNSGSEVLNENDMPKILTPDTGSSLLSWFATNTNNPSCSTYGCPVGYQNINGTCQLYSSATTSDCENAQTQRQLVNVILNSLTNYCATSVRDVFNNCCVNGTKNNGICVPDSTYHAFRLLTTTCNENNDYYCPGYTSSQPRQIYIYCVTTADNVVYDSQSGTYVCPNNGYWIMVDQYGNYFDTSYQDTNNDGINDNSFAPTMTYNQRCSSCSNSCTPNTCTYGYSSQTWNWTTSSGSCISTPVPTDNEFLITY